MGVSAPKSYLLSPNRAFTSKYAVAIEYLDGFRNFKTENLSEEMKRDLISQLALCPLLRFDDAIQLSCNNEHVYSYDFSEGFNIVDMRLILRAWEEVVVDFLRRPLQQFKRFTEKEDFNVPGLACEFHIAPEEMRRGMIATVKRAATITDEELDTLSDELMEMYPMAIAVYYEECIRAIRDRAMRLKNHYTVAIFIHDCYWHRHRGMPACLYAEEKERVLAKEALI